MNYSTYRFTLDTHRTKSQISIQVPQHDTALQLFINLTDGGKPYDIAEGCTAKLYGKKADGKVILHDCEITDNNTRIHYVFSEQTTSCIGPVDCEIRLYGSEGLLLTTPTFVIAVEERVVSDDDVVDSGWDFDALDKALSRDQEYQKNEQARDDAEKARDRAEQARADDEKARDNAEQARDKAEQARDDAEKQRKATVDQIGRDIDSALARIIEIQERLINGELEYELGVSANGDPYYIVKGIGTHKSTRLVIPDTYNGVVVSKIAAKAFQGNTKLTSAVIGKNILEVGWCAFEGCTFLRSIELTKERRYYEDEFMAYEESYCQTDMYAYSRLASDSDPNFVASLWTVTRSEVNEDFEPFTTDAWYWASAPA